jgi:uncharacterized membrane protein
MGPSLVSEILRGTVISGAVHRLHLDAGVSVHQIWGTFEGLWYVTLFGAIYLWRAGLHCGWRRTMGFFVVAFGVGSLAENLSVNYGFPDTSYAFNPALRSKELWIVDVLLFLPLSYAFICYFAYAGARIIRQRPVAHTRVASLARGRAGSAAVGLGHLDPRPGRPSRRPDLRRANVRVQGIRILVRPATSQVG